jgi:hypothetical protein
MRYQIEGRGENGQWSWSNVSADGVRADTIFEDRQDAEYMADYLAKSVYQCPRDEIRVVELDTKRSPLTPAHAGS